MSIKQEVGVRMAVLRAFLEAQSVGWQFSTYDAIKVQKWAWVRSTVQ